MNNDDFFIIFTIKKAFVHKIIDIFRRLKKEIYVKQ